MESRSRFSRKDPIVFDPDSGALKNFEGLEDALGDLEEPLALTLRQAMRAVTSDRPRRALRYAEINPFARLVRIRDLHLGARFQWLTRGVALAVVAFDGNATQ